MASAEFRGIAAPLTVKLAPGSNSNIALSEGLLTEFVRPGHMPADNRTRPCMYPAEVGAADGKPLILFGRRTRATGVVNPAGLELGNRQCH